VTLLSSGSVFLIKLLPRMNRHPEVRLTSARSLQRASRTEGPCAFYYIQFMSLKRKVPQGSSPADLPILAKSGREWGPENAGLAYAFRDDDIFKSGKIPN
jgi:hypothetical protein